MSPSFSDDFARADASTHLGDAWPMAAAVAAKWTPAQEADWVTAAGDERFEYRWQQTPLVPGKGEYAVRLKPEFDGIFVIQPGSTIRVEKVGPPGPLVRVTVEEPTEGPR